MNWCKGERGCCSFGCKAQLGGYCSWKPSCLQVSTWLRLSRFVNCACFGLAVKWPQPKRRIYLTRKAEAAEQCGIEYQQLAFPPSITQKDLLEVASKSSVIKIVLSSSYLLGDRGIELWSNSSWSYSSASFTPSYVRKQVWTLHTSWWLIWPSGFAILFFRTKT